MSGAAWEVLIDMLEVAGLSEEDVIGTPGSPPPLTEKEFLELIGGIATEGTTLTNVQRTLVLTEWRKRTGNAKSQDTSRTQSIMANGLPRTSSLRTTGETASPPRTNVSRNAPGATATESPPSRGLVMSNPQKLNPYNHVGTSATAQQLITLLEEGNAAPALHAASALLERDAGELIQVLHQFLPHIPAMQLQDILGIKTTSGNDTVSILAGGGAAAAGLSSISGIPNAAHNSISAISHLSNAANLSPIQASEARLAAHGVTPSSNTVAAQMSGRHTVDQSGVLRDDSVSRRDYEEALRAYEANKSGDFGAVSPSRVLPRVVDIPPSVNGVVMPEGMMLTSQALAAQYGAGCLVTANGGRILHLPHILQPGDIVTVLRAQELVAVERDRERSYRRQ